MNVATYMSQLAQQVGFIYVPKCASFKNDVTYQKGAAFGVRQGYLVALALTVAGRTTGFVMVVRYAKSAASEQIQEAIKNHPGFSKFLAKKSVKASADGVVVSWTFGFSRTKIEEVISSLDVVIQEVSKYAAGFAGKCEDCATAEARQITLMNGM